MTTRGKLKMTIEEGDKLALAAYAARAQLVRALKMYALIGDDTPWSSLPGPIQAGYRIVALAVANELQRTKAEAENPSERPEVGQHWKHPTFGKAIVLAIVPASLERNRPEFVRLVTVDEATQRRTTHDVPGFPAEWTRA